MNKREAMEELKKFVDEMSSQLSEESNGRRTRKALGKLRSPQVFHEHKCSLEAAIKTLTEGERKMKKTKIDWCDCTVNPVIGCKNGCRYCYARVMNDRFRFVNDWESPQFFPERLDELSCKSPRRVFMDSMSDIEYWPYEAVMQTLAAMKANPQHNYIFLSKDLSDGFSLDLIRRSRETFGQKNIFMGHTVDKQSSLRIFEDFDFVSIEPILEPILEPIDLSGWCKLTAAERKVRQVIIGAETGNRMGKVVPDKKWVEDITKICDVLRIRVFMKSSLKEIMGSDFRQDPLIWDFGEGKK